MLKLWAVLCVVVCFPATVNLAGFVGARQIDTTHYHGYVEMSALLQDYANRYPHITQLSSIGQTVEGREMWVLRVTDNPDQTEAGEPAVKLVGNMHGNEAISREVLIFLTQYLCENYRHDDQVTQLVDTTDIYVMPSMNPDGFENAREGQCGGTLGRENANGVDLNRDFPDQFSSQDYQDSQFEPETVHMMKWVMENKFVLSGNFHGGDLVASYPFDDSARHGNGIYSRAPDDDVFKHLAHVYANNHLTMHNNKGCDRWEHFKDGITNGAKWYDVPGGMQDFNYLYSNCFEITLELSCCKYPTADHLSEEWDNNRPALLAYLTQVHQGVQGFVVRSDSGQGMEDATITVQGIDHNVTTAGHGDFWRLLVPGTYTITASKQGYVSETFTDVTVDADQATELNFTLHAVGGQKTPPLSTPHPTQDTPHPDHIKHHDYVEMKNFLTKLIELLCENYGKVDDLTRLVNTTRIHILPSMNPDGYERAQEGDVRGITGRTNAHGLDLNRNFPDQYFGEEELEPETMAVMEWAKRVPFVLSASLHGGNLVADYPFDDSRKKGHAVYSKSPDDAVFQQLARTYSLAHPTMHSGHPCDDIKPDEYFQDGITNGGAWYNVPGVMQDWDYVNTNDFEVAIELGCVKFPYGEDLPEYWQANKEALVEYIKQVHKGVKGFVVTNDGSGIPDASITVHGINHTVTSAAGGDYWRLLVPGTYQVTAAAQGFQSVTQELTVGDGDATWLNFTLQSWNEENDYGLPNEPSYITNEDLVKTVKKYTEEHEGIIRIEETSDNNVVDVEIFGKLARRKRDDDDVTRVQPHVALIGGLNGDEPIGREILTRLIRHLVEGYDRDDRIKSLVDNTHIHVLAAVDLSAFNQAVEGDCAGENYIGTRIGDRFTLDSHAQVRREHYTGTRIGDGFTLDSHAQVRGEHYTGTRIADGFTLDSHAQVRGEHYTGTRIGDGFTLDSHAQVRGEHYTGTRIGDGFTLDSHAQVRGEHYTGTRIGDGFTLDSHAQVRGEHYTGTRIGDGFTLDSHAQVRREHYTGTRIGDGFTLDSHAQFPQIATVKQWFEKHQFDLALSLEAGGLVVRYPLDYPREGLLVADGATTQDDLLFKEIAREYADSNPALGAGVHAVVRDQEGNPVSGAWMFTEGDPRNVSVDPEKGTFKMLPSGQHRLRVEALGFSSETKQVDVKDGQTEELDFVMVREETLSYHGYEDMQQMLTDLAKEYPKITKFYSIGETVNFRRLWVLEISKTPGTHRPGQPEVKFVGNLHGNEVVGRELLLAFIDHLCSSYGYDDDVTKLIDTTRIHILPSLNPDGATCSTEGTCEGDTCRGNSNNVDLNTNFPSGGKNVSSAPLQPETQAIMGWMADHPFVLSVSLFAGHLVATYPYDRPSKLGEAFPDGITNGAKMDSHQGSMQDYNYNAQSCMEIAVWVSCCKYPFSSELDQLWRDNRESLMDMLRQVHTGVKGFVRTKDGTAVPGASITVGGRGSVVVTATDGDYWRLLAPGEYVIRADMEGYEQGERKVIVTEGDAKEVDFVLSKKYQIFGMSPIIIIIATAVSMAAIVCTAVVICRMCRTPAYSYSKLGTSEYGDSILMNRLKKDASQKSLLKDNEYHDDLSGSEDDTIYWKR
uniref:Peptidase M14 domain-containing protein n=1 Tax=Branchiostoma floridae TaxID=7739 RepID=C3YY10_BRAFL|eukprot:XP_002598957.1 hypothetical protein BRAFLDRAFT_79888 [Branchiostoma floridae]